MLDFIFLIFIPQNLENADSSCEALLGHVIAELSKDKSVYEVNAEEALMVSHWKERLVLQHITTFPTEPLILRFARPLFHSL